MFRGNQGRERRLMMLILLLAVVFAVANGWIYREERKQASQHQLELLTTATANALDQIEHWREEREDELRRVAEDRYYRASINDFLSRNIRGENWKRFLEATDNLLSRQHYEGTFLLDETGALRFSAGRVVGRGRILSGHGRAALQSGQVFFDAIGEGNDARIHAMIRVLDSKGHPVGVFGMELSSEEDFGGLAVAWPIAEASLRAFVMNSGEVISPTRELTGEFPLTRTGTLEGGFSSAVDARGETLIVKETPIEGTPWHLVASMDDAAFMESFRRQSLWSASLILLFFMIAGAFAYMAWRRARAQQALRDLEERRSRELLERRFDYLAKFANDAIILFDKDRRIVEVNDKAVELYGYPREEFTAMHVLDILAAKEATDFESDWKKISEKPSVVYETVHRAKDGRQFPVEVSVRQITLEDRFFVQCIIRDVSERKRDETRIRRLTGLYAALSRANEAIARHYSPEGLLPEICRIAVEEGGYSAATVVLADAQGELHIAASAGELGNAVNDPRLLEAAKAQEGPLMKAFREGQAAVSNDYPNDPRTKTAHDLARSYGINSMASFPLRKGAAMIGTLCVLSRERDFFDKDQITLLQDLASDLSQALENMERDQRRKMAERMTRDNEVRYRNLFENMTEGVLVLVRDEANRFLIKDVNSAAEQMEKTARKEMVGRNLVDVFPWAPHCLVPHAEEVWHSGMSKAIPAHCHGNGNRGWRESYVLRLPTEELVVVMEDVTERMEAAQALRSSQERLTAVLEGTEDAYWDFNFETGEMYYSRRFAALFGYAPEELGGGMEGWQKLVHPADMVDVQRRLADHLAGRTPQFISEHRMRHRSRGYIWVRGRGRVVRRADDGRPLRMAGTHTDISAQRASQEQLRLWASVFEHSREGIVVTDAERRIVSVNGAFTTITGYSLEELRGSEPGFLNSEVHDRAFYQTLWAAIEQNGHWQGEIEDRRKDGEIFPLWIAMSAAKDGDGKVQNYIAICSDISERKQAEDRIRYLAYHDALTGLPNRSLFGDRLAFSLAHAERHGQRAAVLFLDLDRFKNINDSLGHSFGDRLLIQVAERLQACVRREDTIGRQGGDEFLVLLSELTDSQQVISVARKVQEELGRPYLLNGSDVHITPSIGIALFPEDGDDAGTLVRNADAAMYYAKERGRNNFQFFTEELNNRARARLSLESDLRRALEKGEFVLHYQPQLDLGSGALVGVEALLRWRRKGKLVPPSEFIPLAEETGLMLPIGEWVFKEVCRQQAAWVAAGLPRLRVAVNVSASEFRQKDWPERVRRATGGGVECGALEVELTESLLLQEEKSGMAVLRALKDQGISLALDDFGTGHSSLSHLRRFPFDHVKVAPSFVRDLTHDPADRAVTEAIIGLAQSLGMRVIAEGVEAEEEVSVLRSQHCDEVQGRYLAPPLAAGEFSEWWRAHL